MLRLPEEIQVDVFLRLPVKTILNCRCVSKPWNTLLCNSKFIKDHLKRTSNDTNPRLMLVTLKHGMRPMYGSIDYASISSALSLSSATCIFDGAISMDYLLQEEWCCDLSKEYWCCDIIGSCNGLICISLPKTNFCFWNPCTGEYKIISWDFYGELRYNVRHGFGYDCINDDYKLVRVGTDYYSKYSQMEVYTLGSKSWKTIESMNHYKDHLLSTKSICFLNGALHWSSFIEAKNSNVIVSFDITSERFMDFSYPEEVNQLSPSSRHDCAGVLGDRLCLMVNDIHDIDGRFDVWLMQNYGVAESWTKQFSFKYCPDSIHFGSLKLVCSFTNGEILIDVGHEKIIHDIKNDATKVLKISGVDMALNEPVSYVESLVSLNSGTFVWERIGNEVTKNKRQKYKY